MSPRRTMEHLMPIVVGTRSARGAVIAPAIDHARDRVELWDGTRRVAVPRRIFTRFLRSQAGKDRSANVCRRVCVAAVRHPRLVGAEVLP